MKKNISLPKALTITALLMIALLLVVTSTFSWYPRTDVETDVSYNTMRYVQKGKITGFGTKTVVTHVGANDNGSITYTEKLTDDSEIPVNDEQIYYFKTQITETGNGGDSVISLYIDSIKASGSSIQIGLMDPEKTFDETVDLSSGAVTNYCLEDNIVVVNNGVVEIYWFIKYTGTTPLELGKFYYVHN